MTHLEENTLNEYLDGTLEKRARQALEAHLATCPVCDQRLNELRGVFAALDQVPEVPLQADIATRVTAEIVLERKRRPVPLWLLLLLAVQAGLALVMLTRFWPNAQQWLKSVAEALGDSLTTLQPAWLVAEWRQLLATQITRLIEFVQIPIPEVPLVTSQWLLLLSLALVLWLVGNNLLFRNRKRTHN